MDHPGKLVLILPDGQEQEFVLTRSNVVLGRAAISDIVLPDAKVSRAHARLECRDPRAEALLATAYNQLQARATKIAADKMRVSYLENVTIHREIVSEWQALQWLKSGDQSDDATTVE